ncbi:Crp/Fnr family transcriptional regulator [Emcibacter sp. SYSU 3D8]|uniref:Crp/Fnr family transcriptional regulator n=1 Tax=Emcibacter sp. SYSU 3D8 TaxID=3133969 RepID=UPI0031FE6095
MQSVITKPLRNRLLAALSGSDAALLTPHLVLVDLEKHQILIEPGEEMQFCWFIEAGIASIVAGTLRGDQTEVGLVGCDGMVDVAVLHTLNHSSLRVFVQAAGQAYRIQIAAIQGALQRSETLRSELLRYSHALLVQVSSTTLANASCTLEERLARWLLMYHDRSDGDDLFMTHEILSLMLNVRRAGVSLTLKSLQTRSILSSRRGVIAITDRLALEKIAGDGYGVAEKLSASSA